MRYSKSGGGKPLPKLCEGIQYTCLERDPCLSGKGMVNYLSLEWGYHKLVFLNDMKGHR